MIPILPRLTLRQLRLVHTVAQLGQLSQAAEALAMTQPAASRTLADIESLVGEPLFDRRPRGMVPTTIGEVFLRHAGALMGQLESMAGDLDAHRTGRAGSITIGTVTGPALGYVVPAIEALKSYAPRAKVTVDVAPSSELVHGLLRGTYDIVLARVPPDVDPNQLEISRGRVEELRFFARASHPLHARAQLKLQDLEHVTWVIQSAGKPIREAIEQAFLSRERQVPRDIVNTSSLLFTMGYLSHTDAVAAVTSEVLDLFQNSDVRGLRPLSLAEDIILSPYHLIRRKGHVQTPICEDLLQILKGLLAAGP